MSFAEALVPLFQLGELDEKEVERLRRHRLAYHRFRHAILGQKLTFEVCTVTRRGVGKPPEQAALAAARSVVAWWALNGKPDPPLSAQQILLLSSQEKEKKSDPS